MTDEEKTEEYADKILSDSKYPFIFNKQKVKAYIIKVYLDSLKCCKDAYDIGLAEGRKEVREHETTCVNRLHHLEKENAELKAQIDQLSNDNHVLKTSFIIQKEKIEKMKILFEIIKSRSYTANIYNIAIEGMELAE